MVSLELAPFAIGRAIDAITRKDLGAVGFWVGVIMALALVTMAGSVLRHRCETIGRLRANYLTIRLVVRHTARLGACLTDRVAAGEVLAISTADISKIGGLPGAVARSLGSAIAVVTVAVVLFSTSVTLGLLVLIGAPALLVANGPLLNPLHKRAEHYRDLQGELASRAGDIVAGLRVLRGIGGEAAFGERYHQDSQRARHAGVQVAKVESLLAAVQVLLPGILVIGVVWIGAQLAVSHSITVGEFVAAYAYAALLMVPMRQISWDLPVLVASNVAAGRVAHFLELEPDPTAGAEPVTLPDDLSLYDADTALTVLPGILTAVVSRSPEESAALAARLGRYADGEVTIGGVPLEKLPVEQVRELILVVDDNQALFSGILGEELGGWPDEKLAEVLHTANAADIAEALPDGLRTTIAERGRSFSGGQQQRLRLARALAIDPPILIMVDPTSAVDAQTEAVIAERVRLARAGRTTVVMTTSPLLLDQADKVAYLEDGRLISTGKHRDLINRTPKYAETVMRDEA